MQCTLQERKFVVYVQGLGRLLINDILESNMNNQRIRLRMELKPEAFERILNDFTGAQQREDALAVQAEFEHLRRQAAAGGEALQRQASALAVGANMRQLQRDYENIAHQPANVSQKTDGVIQKMEAFFAIGHAQQKANIDCPDLAALRDYTQDYYLRVFQDLRRSIQEAVQRLQAKGNIINDVTLMKACKRALIVAQGQIARLRNRIEYGPIPVEPPARPIASLHELTEGAAYPFAMAMTNDINTQLDTLESGFGEHVKSLFESYEGAASSAMIEAECQAFDADMRDRLDRSIFYHGRNNAFFEQDKKRYMDRLQQHFQDLLKDNKPLISALFAKDDDEAKGDLAALYDNLLKQAYNRTNHELSQQLHEKQKQFEKVDSTDLKDLQQASWEDFLQKKVVEPEEKQRAFDKKYGTPLRKDMWGITKKLYRWRRGIAATLGLDPRTTEREGLKLSSSGQLDEKAELTEGQRHKLGDNVELRREGDNLILDATYPRTKEANEVTMWNPFKPIKTARAAASDPYQLFAFSPFSLAGLAYRCGHPILQKYRGWRDNKKTQQIFGEMRSAMGAFAAKALVEEVPIHVSSTNPEHALALVREAEASGADVEYMLDASDMKSVAASSSKSSKKSKKSERDTSRGFLAAQKQALEPEMEALLEPSPLNAAGLAIRRGP